MTDPDPLADTATGRARYSTNVHGNGNRHDHYPRETFFSKYVFSMDHKMIAKQFLVTGMIWMIIDAGFSVIFRLQLGYGEQTFSR